MQFAYKLALGIAASVLCSPALSAQTEPTVPTPPPPITAPANATQSSSQTPAIPAVTGQPAQTAAPQVTFNQGELSIRAQGSTMSEILAQVQRQTGIAIEGPTGSANERVAVSLGPGPAPEVLHQLLQGSTFDYIIVGSAAKAGAVERVVLSMRQGGASASASAPAARPPVVQAPEQAEEQQTEGDQPEQQAQPEQQTPEPQIANPVGPVPGRAPNTEFPPDQQQQESQQEAQPDQQSTPQANQPKTPEQLLRELQQMQQREQNPQK